MTRSVIFGFSRGTENERLFENNELSCNPAVGALMIYIYYYTRSAVFLLNVSGSRDENRET